MAAKPKQSRIPSSLLCTSQQLVAGLQVSRRTVDAWIKAGLPVAQKGRGKSPNLFDPFACCRWWLAHERAKTGEEDQGFAYWRTIKERENAIRARRRNEREAGLFVPRAKTEQELALASQLLREGLETVGHRFGTEVAQMIQSLLVSQEAAWNAAISRIARGPDGSEPAPSPEPSAEPHIEPGQDRLAEHPPAPPPHARRVRGRRNRAPTRQPARRGKVQE